jgi:hypothetical protein
MKHVISQSFVNVLIGINPEDTITCDECRFGPDDIYCYLSRTKNNVFLLAQTNDIHWGFIPVYVLSQPSYIATTPSQAIDDALSDGKEVCVFHSLSEFAKWLCDNTRNINHTFRRTTCTK